VQWLLFLLREIRKYFRDCIKYRVKNFRIYRLRGNLDINALEIAKGLWEESRVKTFPAAAQASQQQVLLDPPQAAHVRTLANYRTSPIDAQTTPWPPKNKFQQANATKSTGPKTNNGKLWSRRFAFISCQCWPQAGVKHNAERPTEQGVPSTCLLPAAMSKYIHSIYSMESRHDR
jgi:hypothetical protein